MMPEDMTFLLRRSIQLAKRKHTLYCDEYHEHRVPRCCAPDCAACKAGRPQIDMFEEAK